MSDTVLASLFSIAGVALGSFITIFGLWWQDKLRFKREEKKYFKRKKEEIYSTMIRWMINYAGYKRNLSKISPEESESTEEEVQAKKEKELDNERRGK